MPLPSRTPSLLAILALAFLVAGPALGAEAVFPRGPALSPDGATVVFSYEGDLWSVPASGGTAQRLTAHPAYDKDPVYSPDGQWICFASDREGVFDLYVIPAQGGLPRRVTYAPTADVPQDWSADGKSILFASRRPWRYPMSAQIQAAPAAGGTPERFGDLFASEIAVAPDGATTLLSVGYERFGRVGYRGSLQSDLWRWRPGSDPVQLTENPGFDTDPMWGADGATIYWRTEDDETGAFNLWRMNVDGTGKTRLTDFREEGVRNARISRDGSRIVCEAGSDLWLLDTTPGATVRKLAIAVAPDPSTNAITTEDYGKDATELSVAAGGDELAMIVHGEIVLVNKEFEGRATVPIPSPWRESAVHFRPGSADTLVFVSDRLVHDGVHYSRVGLLTSADPDTALLRAAAHWAITWLTPEGVEATAPQWSPDGRRIAYRHGVGKLAVMDADGKHRRILVDGWDDPEFSWSPDSRWLAYAAASGPDFNQDVWLQKVEGGDPVNVSQHPDFDEGPVWNQDGTMLAWTSRRYANQYDVVYCYLQRADEERTREEWKILEKTRDKGDKKESKKDDAKEGVAKEGVVTPKVAPIRINSDDIYLRLHRATDLPGDERVVAIAPHGDRLVFVGEVGGQRDLFTVDRFGEDRKALTKGGARPVAATLADDGKTVFFLKGGAPARVPLKGGDVENTSFRARLTLDRPAQRQQIVSEGWRGLRDRFYDPQLHNIDWNAQRKKAVALAAGCGHDEDFADVMNIMLRSLNASHMGYYPANGSEPVAAFLGLAFAPEHRGQGLRVASVTPHGPADREASRLQPGDIVLSIDGETVDRDHNVFAPIVAAGGDPVRVKLRRGDKDREVTLQPVTLGALRQLVYDADIAARRARVEDLGDGRIGYVHIQGMGQREVEIFERDLYAAAHGKDALVIDVRDNGGGWTTDLLLTMLTQPIHAYTIPRDGEVGYPDAERLPMQRWNKPIAVICNEGSYSNAEIFSHAVQTIGRGPVVGMTTGGNVISTGGWRTLDGGFIRLPFRGWYVWGDTRRPERNNLNEEHGGCVPDVLVPMGPVEWLHGTDPQLARAVALAQEAAATQRNVPGPQPRRPGE